MHMRTNRLFYFSLLSMLFLQQPTAAMTLPLPSMTNCKNSIKEFINNNPGPSILLGGIGAFGLLIGGTKLVKSLHWKYIQRKPAHELLANAQIVLDSLHDELDMALKYIERAEKSSSDKEKKKAYKKLKKKMLLHYRQHRYPLSFCVDLTLKHSKSLDWQLKILSYKKEHALELPSKTIEKLTKSIDEITAILSRLKKIASELKNCREYQLELQEKRIRDLEFQVAMQPNFIVLPNGQRIEIRHTRIIT